MNTVYAELKVEALSGDLGKDVYRFLVRNGCPRTAEHCMRVGEEARRLAERFGLDSQAAEYAGYLHDISAVYPNNVRVPLSRSLGIEVLPEEEAFPMIVHQKLSRQMARDLFHVTDPDILDAVGCHTTLRKQATMIDKVLFVADKIEWDQEGTPPYLEQVEQALEISLEHASYAYVNYLWERRDTLKVLHPWLRDAYYELAGVMKEQSMPGRS
ncbi:haloacid dehalogenase [Paenibacillus dendritiformis]|uniref:bis(5'-nucleosyl)-tetraphosphatase (symmetrical) YqeK n=2 Tax=Paenibacillus TaxID=44249 RepID=UPI00143D9D35|nr:bis(5'-nucleosyl)-tetraphosphatase (symmetrical) YqeK [Paenibacillus dendritiformis]NKI24040.1 HD domain-containing protein [Paenibacillus dendritiformis]NRG00763.1 HD domain-containing protein [Paenibacillus dendritiformis]GIO71450.1 haloacid dehalogenase [Paenibacillus dendritiformis]